MALKRAYQMMIYRFHCENIMIMYYSRRINANQ